MVRHPHPIPTKSLPPTHGPNSPNIRPAAGNEGPDTESSLCRAPSGQLADGECWASSA